MFVVELEGFNDGLPYVVSKHTHYYDAAIALHDAKKENPRVRYRVIKVVDDFS